MLRPPETECCILCYWDSYREYSSIVHHNLAALFYTPLKNRIMHTDVLNGGINRVNRFIAL